MPRRLVATVLLGLALAGACGLVVRERMIARASNTTPNSPVATPSGRTPYDPEVASKTVVFWERKAARDPQGFLERRTLAGAYLDRFRERGDIADAVRAEETARASLKIFARNNLLALTHLARALLAQHRFPEALDVARLATTLDPSAARLVADVQIELGEYDDAERVLASAPLEDDDLNYHSLRARLETISGHPDVALRHLREAVRVVDGRLDLPAETAAWCHAMLGHALVALGRLDEAEQANRTALAIFPLDYRALTGLAEVSAWRGDWRSVIDWGAKALTICPQNPEALKLVSNAHSSLGRDDEAKRHEQLFETLAHSFPRIYDRHWALFLAEKGRDLDTALSLARKDLVLRHDIHAHDTLAWVSFKADKQKDAEASIESALSRGTREATLLYHAGLIARSGGDAPRARDFFLRARAVNPLSVPSRWVRWLESPEK